MLSQIVIHSHIFKPSHPHLVQYQSKLDCRLKDNPFKIHKVLKRPAFIMKTKIDSKKPPASSSDSSSSSESSDDEAPTKIAAKAPAKAAVATKTATPKQAEKPASKPAPKVAAKATPVKEAIPPKPVPASKFPKRAASSSSSSSSSSDSDSDASPPAKKANVAGTPKPVTNNAKAAANNIKATPTTNNVNASKTALPNNLSSQPIQQGKVIASPKHTPATPIRSQPAAAQVPPSPRRDVPAAAPTPVKRTLNNAPITSAGDESYQRVEAKKLVTSVFGSSCPHCGHDIEVKVKLS